MVSTRITASKRTPAQASDRMLRQYLGYTMKRVYMQVQEDLAETLEPFGLRVGTFSALAVVAGSPGISQTQLSQVLNIKRSGVVVVVDELERAGVMERNPVEGDRRAYSLKLTRAGTRLWEKAEAAVRDHEVALFCDLETEDLKQMHELLGRAASSAARRRRERET